MLPITATHYGLKLSSEVIWYLRAHLTLKGNRYYCKCWTEVISVILSVFILYSINYFCYSNIRTSIIISWWQGRNSVDTDRLITSILGRYLIEVTHRPFEYYHLVLKFALLPAFHLYRLFEIVFLLFIRQNRGSRKSPELLINNDFQIKFYLSSPPIMSLQWKVNLKTNNYFQSEKLDYNRSAIF